MPLRTTAAFVTALALLAGCGGDDGAPASQAAPSSTAGAPAGGAGVEDGDANAGEDAEHLADLGSMEVVAKVKECARRARSVHYVGSITSEGSPFEVDVRADQAGSGTGTLGVGGDRIEMRKLGQDVYVRGDAGFYEQVAGGAPPPEVVGKWLKTDANSSSDVAGFTELFDIPKAIDGMLEPFETTADKGGTSDVDGRQGLTITGKDDARLFASLDGEAYPLRLETGTVDPGRVDFTWDEEVRVEPPPSGEVIDVDHLRSQATTTTP